MKKSELKQLIKEEISKIRSNNNNIIDFLNQNFIKDIYSYTPLKNFNIKNPKATFSSKIPFIVKANVPIKHSYRNFELADIIMNEFPEIEENIALKYIDKWTK